MEDDIMKKLIATLLMVLLMIGLITACSQTEDSKPTQTLLPTSTTEESDDSTTSQTEVSLSGTLNYVSWMTKGEDEPTLKKFTEKYPEVNIESRALEGTGYAASFNTLLLGGDIPDVFLGNPAMTKQLVEEGYIAPVTDLTGMELQSKNTIVNDLLTINGEVYGFALNGGVGNEFIYYDAAFFEEHDLKTPSNVEEFELLCEKIKALGKSPIIVPAGDTWNATYMGNNYFYHSAASCGDLLSNSPQLALLKGEIKVSDLYGDAFRAMKKYYDNGWISEGGLSMGWETAAQYFVDGNAAMMITGNWLPGSVPIIEATDFQIGCFVMPGIPDENGIMYAPMKVDRVVFLSSKSQNPEAAKALFEFMISEEVLKDYITSQGLQGVNIEVGVDPVFEDAISVLKSDDYFLYPGAFMQNMPNGWKPNLSQYSADVFSGADVDELLLKLDEDYDAAISTVDVQSYIDDLSK